MNRGEWLRAPFLIGPPIMLLALTVAAAHPLCRQWRAAEPATHPGLADARLDGSLLSRLFGTGRKVLSRRLVAEADRFFHQGVTHGALGVRHDHPFAAWAEAVSPSHHQELSGEAVEEMMPWLQLAIGADPANAEACAAAAYWLMRSGQMDQSIRVLRKAKACNQRDYRFFLLQGELYLINGDLELALTEIEEAARTWPHVTDPAGVDHHANRRRLAQVRATILHALGRVDAARAAMTECHASTGPGEDLASEPNAALPTKAHLLRRRKNLRHVHHAGCEHLHGPQRIARSAGAPEPPAAPCHHDP